MKRLALIVLFVCVAFPAMAATRNGNTHLLGTFGFWRAYHTVEQSDPVCYMTLTARFPKNHKFARGDAYLTITHRPGDNSKDVISYSSGYNFKPMSSADMRFGKKGYDLFTAVDTAWSRDAATDHHIAASILTSPSVGITGYPSRKAGGTITDRFGLKGARDAYHAIGRACGIETPSLPAPTVKRRNKTSKF